jgi:plastocyanin
LVLAAVVGGILLAACSSTTSGGTTSSSSAPSGSATSNASTGSGAATIVIKNFAFVPATLTVSPGETVTVHNEDTATHTVTAVAPHAGAFNTGNVTPGQTTTFTAPNTAGTYPYICEIHQFMHGTLVVK